MPRGSKKMKTAEEISKLPTWKIENLLGVMFKKQRKTSGYIVLLSEELNRRAGILEEVFCVRKAK